MKVTRKKGAALAGAVALATAAFVAPWEGLYTKPYYDMVGVLTVCYGETEGVKLADRYTPQQCREMLAAKLPRYYSEISACWGPELERAGSAPRRACDDELGLWPSEVAGAVPGYKRPPKTARHLTASGFFISSWLESPYAPCLCKYHHRR